ncbi:MAG: hypothetical protein Q9214_004797 [Letrouitia sp. 1 TL-2023]
MSLGHDQLGGRRPNTQALFFLVPVNEKAKNVVHDEDNHHLVSISQKSHVPSFDIGFHINSHSSPNTLTTLGRDDCDILIRPSSVARTQCSFEIDDPNSGIVMFYDRSHKHNTRVSGAHSKTFESGRSPRKILVYPGFNKIISFGGINGDLIQFEIEWILTEHEIKEVVRKHQAAEKDTIINPRKARTRDPIGTALTSAIMTPEQAFQGPSQIGLRYLKRDLRGVGSFGRVWRAIDVDSGRVMAMKQIDWVPGLQEQEHIAKVRREVELMRRSKHPNIADLITSQGWEDGSSSIKIFMGLEEGNLDGLSTDGNFTLTSGRPERCLQQMLAALDFLDYKGIVHRDVKPENILCSRSSEGPGYHFRLSDFGVGKLAKYAYSCQGTHWYMAPEILRLRNCSDATGRIQESQSSKVDVWSLFVTIAYARDVCSYRSKTLNSNDEIIDAARQACTEHWMSKFKIMAIEDPAHRASALDVLRQLFEGVGATERSNEIEMSEDNDSLFSGPQREQSIQHAQLPILPRRSARARHPFRIEKRTWPLYSRNRSTAVVIHDSPSK